MKKIKDFFRTKSWFLILAFVTMLVAVVVGSLGFLPEAQFIILLAMFFLGVSFRE